MTAAEQLSEALQLFYHSCSYQLASVIVKKCAICDGFSVPTALHFYSV